MQLRNICAAQLRMRHLLRFAPPHWSSSFALTNWSCGRLSRIRDQLLSRDDLRTRSGAASVAFRKGGRGGTAGERREDGADDHPLGTANSESVLGELAAEAQSPRGAAA